MQFDLGAGRLLPKWVVAFYLGGAIVLIPWIVIMFTVPQAVNVPRHWQLVWGGFDCFLVLGFAVTAFRLMTRSPRGAVTAAMTGTMLMVDAWFDVLTTRRGGQLMSILMAIFLEIPCALICFYVSRRIVSLFEQAKEYLAEGGFEIHRGRLIAPPGFPRRAQEHALLGSGSLSGSGSTFHAADPDPGLVGSDPARPEPVGSGLAGTGLVGSETSGSERGLGAPVSQQGLLPEPL